MAPFLQLAALSALVVTSQALRFTLYQVHSDYPITASQGGKQNNMAAFNIDECDVGSCEAPLFAWTGGNLCKSTDLGPIGVCDQEFYIRNFENGSEDCASFTSWDDSNSDGLQQGDIYAQLRGTDGMYKGTCKVDYNAPGREVSHCGTVSAGYNALVTCETI